MLYLTCTTITSVDLALYGVSRVKDWVSGDCGTKARGYSNNLVTENCMQDLKVCDFHTRHTLVAGYYVFSLAVRVSARPSVRLSVRPSIVHTYIRPHFVSVR